MRECSTLIYQLIKYMIDCGIKRYDIVRVDISNSNHILLEYFNFSNNRLYEVHIETTPLSRHQVYLKLKSTNEILNLHDVLHCTYLEVLTPFN